MLSPDKFWDLYDSDFPAQTRSEARRLFRRAIRRGTRCRIPANQALWLGIFACCIAFITAS
jgi:hypothetical protein